jgi:hypothetical protein
MECLLWLFGTPNAAHGMTTLDSSAASWNGCHDCCGARDALYAVVEFPKEMTTENLMPPNVILSNLMFGLILVTLVNSGLRRNYNNSHFRQPSPWFMQLTVLAHILEDSVQFAFTWKHVRHRFQAISQWLTVITDKWSSEPSVSFNWPAPLHLDCCL